MTIDLRAWESTTRYDSGIVIDKAEVEAGYTVIKNDIDRVYADFIKNAYETLRNRLSQEAFENKTPEDVVTQNLKMLYMYEILN